MLPEPAINKYMYPSHSKESNKVSKNIIKSPVKYLPQQIVKLQLKDEYLWMQTTYFHQSGNEYKYLNLIEEVDGSSALRLLGMD